MRVVLVSAHYPPNFTSGGTLVPQRLAHGLAGRGHEVSVYAGYLDTERPALSTWEEDDGYAVTIRWVVTTPWTSWSDRRNFDNPEVADDFRHWLEKQRPDVVHLHSLQTLGGELVKVARESGAKVVLTMHDFWWSCARQFLVDPDGDPCSLVVSCGNCPCQVDHGWLAERNTWLADCSRDAHLVIAPSTTAAAVLAANGVASEKLRVDENGVPHESSGLPIPARPRVPIRFMYAGGEDPMKGFLVLREAVNRIDPGLPWQIDLYNVSVDLHLPQVVSHPAYEPDRLGEVLANHDVLVLPSVMRESHSILTREALAAGLPVVCSDCLGPEEVVIDGVNGKVVATADPDALARAMTELMADPGAVTGMSAVATTVHVRSVEEQIGSTESMYKELLAEVDRPVETPTEVLFVVGIDGAPLRYRAHLPAEALATVGVRSRILHYRDPDVPAAADQADVIVFYRVPATHQMLEVVQQIRERPKRAPILFDVDDLIVDPGLRGEVRGLDVLSPEQEQLWWHGVARYRTMLEVSDGFVGSTVGLCSAVAELTGLPTYRFANGVGQVMAQLSELAVANSRQPGPIRIGYFSGTTTHDADWAMIEPVIVRLMKEHTDLELWVGGHLTLNKSMGVFGSRVRRFPMMDWTRLPDRLRQLDINLAPLAGQTAFNEAKSAIKWLEAALVLTPTVASPTGPFQETIQHGKTGFLAKNEEEWYDSLLLLIVDSHLRAKIGASARRAALLEWSPARQGRRYLDILVEARDRVSEPRETNWQPVAENEPYDLSCLVEPYPPQGYGPVKTNVWRRRFATARRLIRHRGWSGLASAIGVRINAIVHKAR